MTKLDRKSLHARSGKTYRQGERLAVRRRGHHAPTAAQLEEVAGLIEAIRSTRPVYVHCAGGFGRATTMAVALLVRDGMPEDEAIERVRRARPEMVLNDEQLRWLQELAPRRRQ